MSWKLNGSWLVIVAVFSALAGGSPQQWPIAEGGNGHWYELQSLSGSHSWEDAMTHATSLGGYLATLSDAEESVFVFQRIGLGTVCEADLGGFQNFDSPNYSEPEGGWQWVTGEEWIFQNWGNGEPSNTGSVGAEQYLAFDPASCGGEWNDIAGEPRESRNLIVEWSADCNGDGLVDLGQIHDGSLRDVNENGIPDSCEGVGRQWRESDGGNGHWYFEFRGFNDCDPLTPY